MKPIAVSLSGLTFSKSATACLRMATLIVIVAAVLTMGSALR